MSRFIHIEAMRQRLGLEAGDTRCDAEIAAMSARERFELLCGWHLGDPGWASEFLSWAKDAGIGVKDIKGE